MIPKIIHFCWLGSKPLTPLAEKCIASWKRHCPDYTIMMWNESNYDFTKHPYMKQALDAKKWGFVPDYARLDIVYSHGGIYLDTDVEMLKSPDPLLNNKFYAGFESSGIINLGQGFGAVAGHSLLKKLMTDYDNYSFFNLDGSLNLLPSPQIQTKFLKEYYHLSDDTSEIQYFEDATIYPKQYFCPEILPRGIWNVTSNTFSIHHYAASWCSSAAKLRWYFCKMIGHKNYSLLKLFLIKFISTKK